MSTATDGYTRDFAEVAAGETAWLALRRSAAGLPAPDDDLFGLAMSGGGIRSASFNLGVLEALQRSPLMRRIDLLSTVSGGGFIGSTYHWLRATGGTSQSGAGPFAAESVDGAGTALDWVRAHGRYLVTHAGFSVWTLLASMLAAVLINLLVLGPVLLLALDLMALGWLPIGWPVWLRPPGSPMLVAHDGFLLLLGAGALCVVLFLALAMVFAVSAGAAGRRSIAITLRLRLWMGRSLLGAAIMLGLGSVPLATAAGEAMLDLVTFPSLEAHASWLMSFLTGAAAVLLGRDGSTPWRARLGMAGLVLIVFAIVMLGYHFAAEVGVVKEPLFAAAFAVSYVLACACDINAVSMHAYYRGRLAEAFMPRTVGGQAADPATFALDAVGPAHGAPMPLLNTTLNTISARSRQSSARGGESFAFTPMYVGSAATGWRRLAGYPGLVALSTAMTISGAAVDPNMYATRARAVSALMALFNLRLGFWALNPSARQQRSFVLPWWWLFIAREMFGIGLDANRRHVHLSDGGHFDNLGLYELVRRRTRYMLVVDAGADPLLHLSDLGQVIERVRVDFGAEISMCADDLRAGSDGAFPTSSWLLGTVRYADGTRGDIVYLKAQMCSGLSADVAAYQRAHPSFPNESTANQFFDEAQFEAYRILGRTLTLRLLGDDVPADVASLFERLRGGREQRGTRSLEEPARADAEDVSF
ncbi:MAG: hypothetical protein M3Q42_13865 [Pseudomonadota bacterium]|nr:hypothetical protein [Pseudomonadota bacterium]